jgi:hypothetical protein
LDTGNWKEDAKTRMVVFSLMKSCWKGSIMRRKDSIATAMSGERRMLRTRGDTGSYPKRIADAEWIFSRGEALLLATTATTSEMPGGMKRLTHRNEYKQVCRKVKNSCQFSD